MADPFPLYLPPEARRLFQTESLLRRFANNAHWNASAKLLEFHGSLGGLALAKALNCTLTVVEPEIRVVDALRERARAAGMLEKVTFLNQHPAGSSFGVGTFDGIFSFGRVVGPLATIAATWRTWLAPRGRAAITTVVKVGRQPSELALTAWEKRLGAPLLLPRDALLAVETQGFEPEMVESAGDLELEDYYRELENVLNKAVDGPAIKTLRDEIALHRSLNGKSGVTYAAMIFRRKEPDEKPPASRDGG